MMTKKEIEQALLKAAPERRISCEAARALAQELGIPYKTLGQSANELGIKINSCQLGCF